MAAATAKRHHSTTGDALLAPAGRVIAYFLVGKRCPVCSKRVWLGRCAGIDVRDTMEMDHLVALENGGGVEGNLIPMCQSCNASKGDSVLSGWLPGRMLETGRAHTLSGARRAATNRITKLERIRAELTTSLIEAGIWS